MLNLDMIRHLAIPHKPLSTARTFVQTNFGMFHDVILDLVSGGEFLLTEVAHIPRPVG